MDVWEMFGQFGCILCDFAQHRLYLLSCRELRGALLLLLQAQHGWAGAAAGMGAGGPAGWVQQNGAGWLPVEAVLRQPALQGQPADVCMWRLCLLFYQYGHGTTLFCCLFFSSFFQRWATRTLQICLYLSRPRPQSSWAAPSSGAEADFLPCPTTAGKLMYVHPILSILSCFGKEIGGCWWDSSIHPFIALFHYCNCFIFLWAVNSSNFTKTRKQKFKILCVRYQQILMHSC